MWTRIRGPVWQVCFSILAGSATLLSAARGDETFSLEIPGQPNVRSQAYRNPGGLIIEDSQGVRHRYERRPEHDTPDGEFEGYYSRDSRKFLRWPVRGTGAMQLGSSVGDRVTWQASRMQVHPIDPANRPVPREPDDRPGRQPARIDRPALRQTAVVAALDLPDGLWAAYFDQEGAIQFFEQQSRAWKHRPSQFADRLPPGAPLLLLPDPNGLLPKAAWINDLGELVELTDGRNPRTLTARNAPRLFGYSHLTGVPRQDATHLATVDDRGRIWEFAPGLATFLPVESRADLFEPGIPLTAVSSGGESRLFGIDRRGHLLGYRATTARWSAPVRIAGNLVSGGFLASAVSPQGDLSLASVDVQGRLRVWTEAGGVWSEEVCPDNSCVPGGGIALTVERGPLSASAIDRRGSWIQWDIHRGRWSQRAIADGFLPGGAVCMFARGPAGCAIDGAGRLVAAQWLNGTWQSFLCVPGLLQMPSFLQRKVIPAEALPPVRIDFENSHREELVARILDDRGNVPREVRIAPGDSVSVELERTPGALLEETYTVVDPAGNLVQETQQIPLPAPPRYTVLVYVNRVTSMYFDRTRNKSNTPDEVNLSLVSLGAFPLPPGDELQDGERIDVYSAAVSQRNPGAAAILAPGPP